MKDNNVYTRKSNGRYEPIGLQYDHDWIGDGIWSVSHRPGCSSIKNLSYYGEILKVGDAKYPDFSKLAGALELADLVRDSDVVRDVFNRNHSIADIVNTVVSEAVRISEEIELKSRNRPLIPLDEAHLKSEGFTNRNDFWEKKIDGTWYKALVICNSYDDPRYAHVEVYRTYDNEKIAEFRAKFLHQIYQFIENL